MRFLAVLLMLGLSQVQSNSLESYKWQNRLILLFAPNADHNLLQEQMALLETHKAELLERDLLVLEIYKDGGVSPEGDMTLARVNALRDSFGVQEGFTVFLIGKDGGVKRQANQALSSEDLFMQIDAMPMRVREMQDQDDAD